MVTNYSGQRWSVVTKTGSYTLVDTDYVVIFDTGAGDLVAQLPPGVAGMAFKIKKSVVANLLTITPDGGELIDGEASLIVSAQWDAPELVFDGTNWGIV